MNARNEALAREMLKTMDAQGDAFALMTDDIEFVYPKWGAARGKAELGKFFQDMGGYVRSISHDQSSFRCTSEGDTVLIEGRSAGTLVDGRSWSAAGATGGRFCTSFRIRDGLISGIQVYIDPDYADQTTTVYPWRKS
jgi:hypothetical protein